VAGKRQSQHVRATKVSGCLCRLFYVTYRTHGVRYLVDTGAEVSVVPPEQHDRRKTPISSLRAANGSIIQVYGQRLLSLDFPLQRTLRWVFLVADVQLPILGIDFLRHFDLLVDSKRHRLVDGCTRAVIAGILANTAPISPV
jgi:hypothetical protein